MTRFADSDDRDDAEHLASQTQSRSAAAEIRRLRHRADRARSLGHEQLTDELLLEADALEAAILQYDRAIAAARELVDALRHEVASFWDALADDRTLHDLADDASVFLMLVGDLDHAESRLLTLEHARP